MAGTKVNATQAATASAATAEVLAKSNCPNSAAAPEYRASRRATAKAARAKRKVRTGERSERARKCAMAEIYKATKWRESPASKFWNGPVWKIIPNLENAAYGQS